MKVIYTLPTPIRWLNPLPPDGIVRSQFKFKPTKLIKVLCDSLAT